MPSSPVPVTSPALALLVATPALLVATPALLVATPALLGIATALVTASLRPTNK